MRTIFTAAAMVFASSIAIAGERPYLEGRFDLDMSRSSWDGGAKPMTGGFWVFEHDDGKTRKGYVVQYGAGGRPLVYHYNHQPYDGKMYWLNDWYRESETYVDDNTFKFAWEVHRGETPMPGQATCKISEARDEIHCEGTGFVEVYEKMGN